MTGLTGVRASVKRNVHVHVCMHVYIYMNQYYWFWRGWPIYMYMYMYMYICIVFCPRSHSPLLYLLSFPSPPSPHLSPPPSPIPNLSITSPPSSLMYRLLACACGWWSKCLHKHGIFRAVQKEFHGQCSPSSRWYGKYTCTCRCSKTMSMLRPWLCTVTTIGPIHQNGLDIAHVLYCIHHLQIQNTYQYTCSSCSTILEHVMITLPP